MDPALPGEPPPKLQALYEALKPYQKAALRTVIADPSVSADDLSRTLREHGHDIGPTTLKAYRRSIGRSRCAS